MPEYKGKPYATASILNYNNMSKVEREIQITCTEETNMQGEETKSKRNAIIWILCQQSNSTWNNESDNRLNA